MAGEKGKGESSLKLKALVILLLLAFLSGCMPTNIIDDILMVEAEGFDYIGHNQIVGTATMPNYVQSGNPGGQGGGLPSTASMMRYVSGVTYDGKSLVDKFQPEGQRKLKVGKLRVMLFDKKLAKHGMRDQIDFRNRDPDTPRDLTIAVVEGSTKKLLTAQDYQTQIPISRYVQDMIQQNNEQNYPSSNVAQFIYSYYGNYMDPFMPLIKKNGNHLEMTGIAIFKKDKYVMKVPNKDTFIFKMLFKKFNQGVYDFEFAPKKHIAIRNVRTTINYKVKDGNSSAPVIYAYIKINGQVRQAHVGSISKSRAYRVEKPLEKQMEQKASKLVRTFQKKGTDPLRLGDTVRSFTYNFDGKSWPERYQNAHFHCQVTVNISQTGISE